MSEKEYRPGSAEWVRQVELEREFPKVEPAPARRGGRPWWVWLLAAPVMLGMAVFTLMAAVAFVCLAWPLVIFWVIREFEPRAINVQVVGHQQP